MRPTDTTDPGAPAPRPDPDTARDAVLVVLTNVPDEQTAQTIAQALVDEGLAACVNILAQCTSVYRWQGRVEQAREIPLLIKTAKLRYPALAARLAALHPYEVAEILAWAPGEVSPPYADWVIESTRAGGER